MTVGGTDDRGPAPPRGIRRWGVAIGFFGSLLLGAAFLFAGAVSWVAAWLVAAASVMGALALVIGGDRFRRDLGSGLLIGIATVAMIFGSCYAIISNID